LIEPAGFAAYTFASQRMKSGLIPFLLFLGIARLNGASSPDYVRDIKPLLAENCYKCHGASAQKGGLRLDTAAAALKGGDSGPAFVPGKSGKSLLIAAVEGTAKDLDRMPLKKPALSEDKIALLKKWIDAGAFAPADEKPDDGNTSAKHWAFVAPVRQSEPKVKQTAWPRNSIDRFILARLEKEGIKPSPEADRISLIRRVSLDLTGLPPKPAEVDAFLADKSSDAYEKLVDRLLASPHYGERWGRHWLDVARYADSNGYSIDAPRQIWKYRDWVINAFNADMPFDEFTIEQIAGDMLPNATTEQKIATGFHRNTMINEEGGIDKEQFRIESILDRVNTTGSAFLGLTIGCCQCHDHKFDPLLQKEYYQLFAFLNNSDEPTLDLATPEEIKKREIFQKQIKDVESEINAYVQSLAPEMEKWEKGLTPEQIAKLESEPARILKVQMDKRTDKERRALAEAFRKDDAEMKKWKARITKIEKQEKKEVPAVTTLVMQERSTPRESYRFIKGDFTRHGEIVKPGVPKILHPLANTNNPNRLDLAKWIVDPANPLTSRVIVNRMWQEYFGKGIVETENDFGTQGAPPSHPELLDWLATEFIKQRWSMKSMHRLIVTSATYRQSSHARPELALVDPNNKLLARQSRIRLDAEVVRDVALSASGMLNETIGGPSVYPPLPDGVMTLGQTKREWTASTGVDRYRRGMYTFFWRATPHPSLTVFDAPDATSTCTRRPKSNTPLQSLTLLNDQGFFELAQDLAMRVLKEAPKNAQVDYAFQLCVARKASAAERQRIQKLLDQQMDSYEAAPEEAKLLVSNRVETGTDMKQLAAWTTVSRALLNLDETITRE
jgi:mono/diheme cytochrome c family protein